MLRALHDLNALGSALYPLRSIRCWGEAKVSRPDGQRVMASHQRRDSP